MAGESYADAGPQNFEYDEVKTLIEQVINKRIYETLN
jgi:hypothetical protein